MGLEFSRVLLAGIGFTILILFVSFPKRTKKIKHEDAVLAELEVFTSYGQHKKARKLLNEAIAARPNSWALKDWKKRLDQL